MSQHDDLEVTDAIPADDYPVQVNIIHPTDGNPSVEITIRGILLAGRDPAVLVEKIKAVLDGMGKSTYSYPSWPGRFIPDDIRLEVTATVKTAWAYSKQEAEEMGWVQDADGRYRRPW